MGDPQPTLRIGDEVRKIVVWPTLESEGSTVGELGEVSNQDSTSLSAATGRLVIRAKRDLELVERMKELLETVS